MMAMSGKKHTPAPLVCLMVCLLAATQSTRLFAEDVECSVGEATNVAKESGAEPASVQQVGKLIGEADCLRQAASRAGGEWLKTGEILDRAREAAKNGETDKARKLAEQARFQAITALGQAKHEAEAWKERVIR